MHIGSWMRSPQPLFLLAKRRHSYITTPIFYVNAAPHLGHLYTAVLSDAANRWMKMKDPEGLHILVTGTDEHGIKILRAAEKTNKDPQVFCDETSGTFRELFKKFGIQNTDFIRTSEVRHKRCVEHVWKRLYDRDFIYKDVYSGWYSATDECFFTDNEIQDTPSGKVVKGSNHPVEFVEEQNYMFRLSPLKGKVRQWLTKSDVIYPKLYLPQALQFLEYDGDLSVSRSRSRLPWGIPVPGDDTQTVYVWMDALMNYLSAVGYPETLKSWPPTWQIIGKDILKFHAFYWPAFLIALELPLPEKLFVHGHWLIDGVKMSKSLGNVVNPFDAAKSYSADGLRYFLLKQGVPHGDSNFSNEKAIHVINSDLVNNVGNLLSRATVKKLNPSQEYPKFSEAKDILEAAVPFLSGLKNIEASTEELYDELLFYKAIEGIMAVVKGGNGFFQLTQPWKLEPGPELSAVLYITYEAIRVASILLQPVIPTLADQALTRMQAVVLLLALASSTLACSTWPNGTDTTFHWYQCNSGPLTYYNATPYDETGTTFEYPIHLGKPLMVKCDVMNPTHVYSSPNLILNINLWSWGTSLGTCAWSSLPTFGMLSNLDACSHGITCPIKIGRQELDVMVDFTKYQAIINMLKDDSPYQLEYAMHDKISKDDTCFMAQARAKLT